MSIESVATWFKSWSGIAVSLAGVVAIGGGALVGLNKQFLPRTEAETKFTTVDVKHDAHIKTVGVAIEEVGQAILEVKKESLEDRIWQYEAVMLKRKLTELEQKQLDWLRRELDRVNKRLKK